MGENTKLSLYRILPKQPKTTSCYNKRFIRFPRKKKKKKGKKKKGCKVYKKQTSPLSGESRLFIMVSQFTARYNSKLLI